MLEKELIQQEPAAQIPEDGQAEAIIREKVAIAAQPDLTSPAPQHPIPIAVVARPVPEDAGVKHPALYFNMELGWIDFNWRVLHLA